MIQICIIDKIYMIHYCTIEIGKVNLTKGDFMKDTMAKIKWRPILGLVLVYLATFMQWYWVWGILFILWVLPDIFSRTTHFMDSVTAEDNPILFWVIIVTWLGLSVWYLSVLFIDYGNYYGY